MLDRPGAQELAGSDDLSAVKHLNIRADLEEGLEAGALRDLGERLPMLEELRLANGSRAPRIRDLGTSLPRLRVLWLARCGVQVCRADSNDSRAGCDCSSLPGSVPADCRRAAQSTSPLASPFASRCFSHRLFLRTLHPFG